MYAHSHVGTRAHTHTHIRAHLNQHAWTLCLLFQAVEEPSVSINLIKTHVFIKIICIFVLCNYLNNAI